MTGQHHGTTDKYVLPILSDLRFRMQHNRLNVRKKYRYTASDTNCPHGCPHTESVKHLFWTYKIAREIWPEFLDPISMLAEISITWEGVAYMTNLHFTKRSVEDFSHGNLLLVFHIIRSAVLYPIWIHRNDRIFQEVQSSAAYVLSRAMAHTRLHLSRLARRSID
eukprot:jgi/Phyca11/119496/e_gw1.38.325.1